MQEKCLIRVRNMHEIRSVGKSLASNLDPQWLFNQCKTKAFLCVFNCKFYTYFLHIYILYFVFLRGPPFDSTKQICL